MLYPHLNGFASLPPSLWLSLCPSPLFLIFANFSALCESQSVSQSSAPSPSSPLWFATSNAQTATIALPLPPSFPLFQCFLTSSQVHYYQKMNFVLSFECCCCEQPISSQKLFFTAISLDAHNDNIRNLAQNSASDHHNIHL